MKQTSILRTLSPMFFSLTLALVACDSSGSEPASAETGGAELASPVSSTLAGESGERSAHRDHHRKGKGQRATKRVERLCELVSCDSDQREALLALASPEPKAADEAAGRHTKIKDARKELAQAFRGEGFAGADLEVFFAVLESSRRQSEGGMADRAAKAHGILSVDQRELLAQRVESGEFAPGARHRGRGGLGGETKGRHHHGRKGAKPGAAHIVERLCEKLECSDAQRGALTELAVRHHESRKARREARDPARGEQLQAELAAMIRADTLDAATIEAHMQRVHAQRGGHRDAGKGQIAELAVDLHGLLTPVQRVQAAEQIESGRLPGMFGGGKKGRHHRSRH